MKFEFYILDWIQSMRSPVGDWFMPLITGLGDGGIVWLSLTLGFLLHPKTRKTGVVMMLGLAIQAVLCNVVLKPLTARIRPYDVNQAVQLLIKPQWDYSFPSGHTAASFASVWALWLTKTRYAFFPALGLALLIAWSRLYLYVHYPTDVLAGIGIGIASAWCGMKLLPKLEEVWKGRRV